MKEKVEQRLTVVGINKVLYPLECMSWIVEFLACKGNLQVNCVSVQGFIYNPMDEAAYLPSRTTS